MSDVSSMRSCILRDAAAAVTGDREGCYGSPESNFERIAKLWNVYLGFEGENGITPADVATMMILLKVSRIASKQQAKVDNWIDIAGYAACGGEIDMGGAAE